MTNADGTYSKLVRLERRPKRSIRKNAPTKERPTVRRAGRPEGRPDERPNVPATSRRSAERTIKHRPYSFFSDQVRWLNRKKLDLDERYGRRVPATAMVQLAVDMLIADYEEHGEDSQLVKTLIDGHTWPRSSKAGAQHGEKGSDGKGR